MNSACSLGLLWDLSDSWESWNLARLSLNSHGELYEDDVHDHVIAWGKFHWFWAQSTRLCLVKDPACLGNLSHLQRDSRPRYSWNSGLYTVISVRSRDVSE